MCVEEQPEIRRGNGFIRQYGGLETTAGSAATLFVPPVAAKYPVPPVPAGFGMQKPMQDKAAVKAAMGTRKQF